jgi:hypothetical protein
MVFFTKIALLMLYDQNKRNLVAALVGRHVWTLIANIDARGTWRQKLEPQFVY